ncbi:flagellar basal body rod protein FlgC [Fodinibius sp. Rm-B-1B1-1]|uniref:flagellar basal body rod protein FlgC n=1 Tax=Fodinibius alkaliphilus TaxID=3140241 RepID=UPI003159A9CA
MIPDRLSSAFQTAAKGLAVQRERINVASRNIANVNTSSAEGSGKGYRPQSVQSSAPQPTNFQRVLSKSMGGLNKTREQHMSPKMSADSNSGPQSLGPNLSIAEEDSYRYEYEPNHPDANEEGMVRYPDIDMVEEMTRMVSANRMYEANLSSIEAEKEIMKRSLQI